MKTAITIAILLGSSIAGRAQQIDVDTAAQLNSTCHSTDSINKVMCYGTVTGIVAGLDLPQAFNKQPSCRPDTLTREQTVEIFEVHMIKHPEQAQYPAAASVLLALAEAFPCK